MRALPCSPVTVPRGDADSAYTKCRYAHATARQHGGAASQPLVPLSLLCVCCLDRWRTVFYLVEVARNKNAIYAVGSKQ
jgi:hypothetical protein